MISREMKQAQEAFRGGKASDTLAALEKVFHDADSPTAAAAHLMRGLVFEFGGEGVQVDLSKAVNNYRMASHLVGSSDAMVFLYLARASMKQGTHSYPEALKYIQEASAVRHSPNVDLAFAEYYEVAESERGLSKKYYFKAAVKGRFAGFFGLASALRKDGQRLQALMVDIVRIILGPVLLILLGRAARDSFNGY